MTDFCIACLSPVYRDGEVLCSDCRNPKPKPVDGEPDTTDATRKAH